MVQNIIVVDENDNVIGCKPRDVVDKEGLMYRVSGLWIKNSRGESLLARRAYTKTHSPGRWGPAAAGTVDEGETYEENMVKEAEEELGLMNVKFEKGPHIGVSGKYNYFTQWFSLLIDEPENYFKIQEEVVVEVKWFSEQELRDQLEKNPKDFLKNMGKYLELFY